MRTNGPWQMRYTPSMFEVTADSLVVLRQRSGMMPSPQDAALITAAPMLEQALRDLMHHAAQAYEYANAHGAEFSIDAEMHVARAALKAATGE